MGIYGKETVHSGMRLVVLTSAVSVPMSMILVLQLLAVVVVLF
jgi:hypothetical protein